MKTLTLEGANVVPGVPWKLECPGRHRGCPGDTTDVPKELVRVPRRITLYHKRGCLHSDTMVTREGQVVTGGGEKTPLSAVRPYGMEVPPSEALDMSGSPHLTIGYLLRIGCGTWSPKLVG